MGGRCGGGVVDHFVDDIESCLRISGVRLPGTVRTVCIAALEANFAEFFCCTDGEN